MNAFLLSKKYILIIVLFIVISLAGIFVLVLNKNDQKNISIIPTPTLIPEPTITPPVPTSEFAPDRIIVEFKAGQSINEIKDENRKSELRNYLKDIGVISEERVFKNTEDPSLRNFYILKLKEGTDVLETKKLLEKLPEVKSAEPDHVIRAL